MNIIKEIFFFLLYYSIPIIFGILIILFLPRNKRLKKLLEKINDLSRLNDRKEILNQSTKDFVELFDFDFSLISTIPFVYENAKEYGNNDDKENINKEQKLGERYIIARKFAISEKFSLEKETNAHPKEWYEKSNHDFSELKNGYPDLLVEVVNRKQQAVLIRRTFVEESFSEKSLHDDIYNYDHQYLARIYFPIIYRYKNEYRPATYNVSEKHIGTNNIEQKYDADFVLGVVECGYYLPRLTNFISRISFLDPYFRIFFYKLLNLKNNTLSGFVLSFYTFIWKGTIKFTNFVFFRTPSFTKSLGYTLHSIRLHGQLYADNLAQEWMKVYVENASKKLIEKIYVHQDIEDPKIYAEAVLKTISDFIGAKIGVFAFNTLNHNFINFVDAQTTLYKRGGNVEINEDFFSKVPFSENPIDEDHKSIVHLVWDKKKPYITDSNDPFFQNPYKNEIVHSELVMPLIQNNNECIGVALFDSDKVGFFGIIHEQLLKDSLSNFVYFYHRKKRYNFYTTLTKQPNFGIDQENIFFFYISKALSEFFNSDYVAIWQRDRNTNYYPEKKGLFKLLNFDNISLEDEKDKEYLKLNQSFYKIYNDNNLIQKEWEIKYQSNDTDADVSLVRLPSNKSKPIIFDKLCQENDFHFYILIRVALQNKFNVFINILSKRNIFEGISEEKQEEKRKEFIKNDADFLKNIADRVSSYLQNLSVFNALTQSSASLFSEKETENTIQTIANQALEVTRADIISIYPNDGSLIQSGQRKGIIIGNINSQYEDMIDKVSEENAALVNTIISAKEKTLFWYNINHYEVFCLQNQIKAEKSFWEYNNIETVFIEKIVHEEVCVGIIFFNFQDKKEISKTTELRTLIGDFANLIGIHFRNSYAIKNIRLERKRLLEYLNEQERLLNHLKKLTDVAPFGALAQAIHHSIKDASEIIFLKIKQLLQSENLQDKTTKAELEKLLTVAENSSKNIKYLLAIAKENKDNLTEINVNSLIETEISQLTVDINYWNIEIMKKFSNLQTLTLIKVELSLVFYNFIKNAIDAISEKQYNIELSNTNLNYKGQISIETQQTDDYISIIFADNGIGIKDEIRNQIYELGISSKPLGTGIGLYFINQIIKEKYQGEIIFESTYNKGTTFEVRIPLKRNNTKTESY